MTSIDSVRSEVSKTVRFIFLASKLTILGFSLFTFLFSVYCHSSSKSDVCLTSLLSNAGRFIPEKKLGYNSVLFWHKVDSIISLSRVEHANFFFVSTRPESRNLRPALIFQSKITANKTNQNSKFLRQKHHRKIPMLRDPHREKIRLSVQYIYIYI